MRSRFVFPECRDEDLLQNVGVDRPHAAQQCLALRCENGVVAAAVGDACFATEKSAGLEAVDELG